MAIEILASGYTLVEAPRVDELDRLYFSDVRVNGGDISARPGRANRDLDSQTQRGGGIGP